MRQNMPPVLEHLSRINQWRAGLRVSEALVTNQYSEQDDQGQWGLVRHARRLVLQLAEVLVTREMLPEMLERIRRLHLAPVQPAVGGRTLMTTTGSSRTPWR